MRPKNIRILKQCVPQNNSFTQKYLTVDEPPVNIDTNTRFILSISTLQRTNTRCIRTVRILSSMAKFIGTCSQHRTIWQYTNRSDCAL